MSVKIRLSRHGSKKNPLYFVVASRSEAARDGDFLEKLGQYRPKETDPAKKLTIEAEKVQAWIAKGAQVTRTVGQLLNLQAK